LAVATPYDDTTKHLVEGFPGDWLALAGWAGTGVSVIDADLATVTARADKVIRVEGVPPWLLHLELQASYRLDVPGRVEWYNGLLRYRHCRTRAAATTPTSRWNGTMGFSATATG
jgi:hypothetical protein